MTSVHITLVGTYLFLCWGNGHRTLVFPHPSLKSFIISGGLHLSLPFSSYKTHLPKILTVKYLYLILTSGMMEKTQKARNEEHKERCKLQNCILWYCWLKVVMVSRKGNSFPSLMWFCRGRICPESLDETASKRQQKLYSWLFTTLESMDWWIHMWLYC